MKVPGMQIAVLLAWFGLCSNTEAQPNVSSQKVSIVVSRIQAIQFQNSELSFEISTAEPGEEPNPSEIESRFSITNNTNNWIITAQLDENLPSGLTLEAQINLGQSGDSGKSDYQQLSTVPTTLLTGSEAVKASNQTIRFRAKASQDLEPGSYSRAVVFTITTRN